MPSVKPLLSCLPAVAWPAQRFKIAIVISAAVGFRDDVIHTFGFHAYAPASAVLTEMLIAHQNASAAYLPWPTVPAFLAALPRLVITPAITGVQLAMAIAITGWIIRRGATPLMLTGALSAGWHYLYPTRRKRHVPHGPRQWPLPRLYVFEFQEG